MKELNIRVRFNPERSIYPEALDAFREFVKDNIIELGKYLDLDLEVEVGD